MWNGSNGRSSPERFSRSSSGANGNGESPSDPVAVALAARAFANAYDTASQPAASSSSLFDMYGAAAAAQPSALGVEEDPAVLFAQRAREIEMFHLQQQIQERQAIENEARNRLLEHAAQDYERTRVMAIVAEMQQRDREARIEAERSLLQAEAHANASSILSQHEVGGTHEARIEAERSLLQAEAHANASAILSQHEADAAAAQHLREQQLAELIAKQQNHSFDEYGSNPSPQSFADPEEKPAAKELEIASHTEMKSEYPVEEVAAVLPPKRDSPPTEEPSPQNEPLPKKEPPLKKEPPPKKKSPIKKDPPPAKKKSSPKKETPSKKTPPPKKEPAPKKEPTQKKEPATKKEPTTKKEPPSKKEPPVKKESSPKKEPPMKKEPPPKKEKSPPKKKKAPQKAEAPPKTPLETPSSSQPDSDKKLTPEAPPSSTTSRKRKKSPPKSSASTNSSVSKAKKARKSPGTATSGGKKAAPHVLSSLIKRKPGIPSMADLVPEITDVQYENAEALMSEFCKVPFLAEFSRPVSLLHPELVTLYSKIIHRPMDLGHICRAIRRREYKNTRAIQLDVWRVFSNCTKFHMHPSNRDNAIPSFISISIHLRDFFNSLWQEYMMPSDAPKRQPGKGITHVHATFQKRAEARKERLAQISTTVLTSKCLEKVMVSLDRFISSGGKVDKLDRDAILGDVNSAKGDIATFIESLRQLIKTIEMKIESSQEYTVLELHRDMKRCYTEDIFEHEILKKMKISQRLDRILGKALAPIHEVSCRGVNQSSIWGCMAAAIWARESKKKPYWPAIVLGILAPDDQKEDWHLALTERNEARLPEKLREDLRAAKRRAELGLRKQSSDLMSYFLVEFMGSHEFIWVKESDIIESFDPEEDVNIASAAGNITKKRRSTAFNSQQMSNAIEEGRWALEEFELQLNNTCGDRSDDEDDFNDAGYTFDILCQSDDEADEMDVNDEKAHESDIDEQNELLASDGLLDFSVEGRKKAKARATALKKQNALQIKKEKERKEKEEKKEKEKKREEAKKAKEAKSKAVAKVDTKKLEKQLEIEEKREKRELDQRRKKRARDHEKSLKELERKAKKNKINAAAEKKSNPNEVPNKRGRAESLAKGFLVRKSIKDASFNGAAFQPTSSVEPSGLLGMALAFRAAAGEVAFLDNAGKPFLENSWEKIDADSPLESSERCKLLQEQIDLIGKEILKVDASTEQRLALTKDSEKARLVAQEKLLDAEQQVRVSYAKRKKKALAKKCDISSTKSDIKSKTEQSENGKDDNLEGITNQSENADSTISEDKPESPSENHQSKLIDE